MYSRDSTEKGKETKLDKRKLSHEINAQGALMIYNETNLYGILQ